MFKVSVFVWYCLPTSQLVNGMTRDQQDDGDFFTDYVGRYTNDKLNHELAGFST